MSDPDRDDDLILAAAAMFHAAAMQQLGKLVNPLSGKAEVDLPQARLSIDVLGALRAKTEGRLHPEAAIELDRLLFQLRMGFLDEAKRRTAAGESSDGASPDGTAADGPAPDGPGADTVAPQASPPAADAPPSPSSLPASGESAAS